MDYNETWYIHRETTFSYGVGVQQKRLKKCSRVRDPDTENTFIQVSVTAVFKHYNVLGDFHGKHCQPS